MLSIVLDSKDDDSDSYYVSKLNQEPPATLPYQDLFQTGENFDWVAKEASLPATGYWCGALVMGHHAL